METLKDKYIQICNEYLRLFCEKHDYQNDGWVADEHGGIAMCSDLYVDFDTIKTDIDMNVDEDEFIKYYDYTLESSEFGLNLPNFRSWLNDCPRTSEESFQKMREIRAQLEELIEKEKTNV
jgi:hypothetical protein